jgi:uncharacterized protein YndB with AHSA1/START domain
MINTDCVEQTISLCASLDQVWRALTDPEQFGYWFGILFDADSVLVERAQLKGRLAPTKVHPGTAQAQKAYWGIPLTLSVERVEPTRLVSFPWHSFAWQADVDCATEPTTLVVFQLQELGTRTSLTITESGFDRIPNARRAAAFASSAKGWAKQAFLIELFLAGARDLRPVQEA